MSHSPGLLFSVRAPRANSIKVTWELARSAHQQAPLRTCWLNREPWGLGQEPGRDRRRGSGARFIHRFQQSLKAKAVARLGTCDLKYTDVNLCTPTLGGRAGERRSTGLVTPKPGCRADHQAVRSKRHLQTPVWVSISKGGAQEPAFQTPLERSHQQQVWEALSSRRFRAPRCDPAPMTP